MTFWTVRESLSQANKLRRSYYELLRDELDHFMIQYALVDSYNNFLAGIPPTPLLKDANSNPVRAHLILNMNLITPFL